MAKNATTASLDLSFDALLAQNSRWITERAIMGQFVVIGHHRDEVGEQLGTDCCRESNTGSFDTTDAYVTVSYTEWHTF